MLAEDKKVLTKLFKLRYSDLTPLYPPSIPDPARGHYTFKAYDSKTKQPVHIRAYNCDSTYAQQTPNTSVTLFLQEMIHLTTNAPSLIFNDSINFEVDEGNNVRICFAMQPQLKYSPTSTDDDKSNMALFESLVDEIQSLNSLTTPSFKSISIELNSVIEVKMPIKKKDEEVSNCLLQDWNHIFRLENNQPSQSIGEAGQSQLTSTVITESCTSETIYQLALTLLESNGAIKQHADIISLLNHPLYEAVIQQVTKGLDQVPLLLSMLQKQPSLRPTLTQLVDHIQSRKNKPKNLLKTDLASKQHQRVSSVRIIAGEEGEKNDGKESEEKKQDIQNHQSDDGNTPKPLTTSYNRYFSPPQVESDQKDLIISQLKAETFELKQNKRDSHDLSSQLRVLRHRYNLLQEEKSRNEAENKHRNDVNLTKIANLKTDIATLKSTIEEKTIEYQEKKAENLAIKDIADHRTSDISKLKNELVDALEQNNRSKEAKRDLTNQLALARDEKRKRLQQNDGAHVDSEKQQQQLHHNNDSLKIELRTKIDNLRNLEQQINDAERHIHGLEGDIKKLEESKEKERAEVVALRRGHQQEVSKNLELSAKTNNHEYILRTREIQIDDYTKDLDHLIQAQNSQIVSNGLLNNELQALSKQIDALSDTNNQLVSELEQSNQQVEQAIGILNGKAKVNDHKFKSENQLK